jgi:hypothetical protein
MGSYILRHLPGSVAASTIFGHEQYLSPSEATTILKQAKI